VRELQCRDGPAAGKRVIHGKNRNQRFTVHDRDLKLSVVDWKIDQTDIDAVVGDRAHDGVGCHLDEIQFDFGCPAAERSQQRRQRGMRSGWNESDGEPADRAASNPPHHGGDFLHLIEQPTRLRE